MKRIYVIFAILLSLLSLTGQQAFADTCATKLMPVFTSNQATSLCTKLGQLNGGGSIILKAQGDANRLLTFDGSSDTALTLSYGDGTTAAQTLTIQAADTNNTGYAVLSGGKNFGTANGGAIEVTGISHAETGSILLYPANSATGHIKNILTHASSQFQVKSGSTVVSTIDTNGTVTSTGLNFPAANFETVAGAGSTVSDAAALSATKHVHQITGANGTLGWKFASATAGQFEVLLNTTAGVAKVYAVAGGTCNGGAADAACTLLSGIAPHICYATAANAWICS